jgi:hypothetical protein
MLTQTGVVELPFVRETNLGEHSSETGLETRGRSYCVET